VNAISVLLRHIGAVVDGGYVSIEEIARYLGTSPATVRELIDGTLRPSRTIVAEIEALNRSLLSDPKTALVARINAGLERRPRGPGPTKVFDISG
jgi:predicted transcriptional regulator